MFMRMPGFLYINSCFNSGKSVSGLANVEPFVSNQISF